MILAVMISHFDFVNYLIYTQDNLSSLDITSSLSSFHKNTLYPCRAFHLKNPKWFFFSSMPLYSLETKEAFFFYYYFCSSSLLLWVKNLVWLLSMDLNSLSSSFYPFSFKMVIFFNPLKCI